MQVYKPLSLKETNGSAGNVSYRIKSPKILFHLHLKLQLTTTTTTKQQEHHQQQQQQQQQQKQQQQQQQQQELPFSVTVVQNIYIL